VEDSAAAAAAAAAAAVVSSRGAEAKHKQLDYNKNMTETPISYSL
jgi:hypothetical protein